MTTETVTKERIEELREYVRDALAKDTAPITEDVNNPQEPITEITRAGVSTLVRLVDETNNYVTVQHASCYHQGHKTMVPWSNILQIKWDRKCNGYTLHFIVTRTPIY